VTSTDPARLLSLERGIPVSSRTAAGTDCSEMEIAGLGLLMIAISILLLVWAFPKLPNR
jgi:hypothetical protein